MNPYVRPLANALIYETKTVDGKPNRKTQTATKLPGNIGTGTARDAIVNKRKNAKKTGPPRNLITYMILAEHDQLCQTLQDFRTDEATVWHSLVFGTSFEVTQMMRTVCCGRLVRFLLSRIS